jgi:hypothetical protein
MNIVDRFTRDRVSRFVWGGLTVVCLASLVGAKFGERWALQDQEDAAKSLTEHVAETTVYSNVIASNIAEPIRFYYRPFYTQLLAQVFTDPTVARVRVFDTDGVLRFSSERGGQGSLQVDDPGVQAASQGQTYERLTTSGFTLSTVGGTGEATRLFQTYAPLHAPDRLPVVGAVEVDYRYDTLAAAAQDPWRTLQLAFAVLVFLCAAMTALSLRRPTQRVGAGVVALKRTLAPRPDVDGATDGALEQDLAAAGSSSPLVARVTKREEERLAAMRAEADELRGELQASKEQVAQAEEAYGFLETRLHQLQQAMTERDLETSEGADERISQLEEALRATESERDELRAGAQSDPAVEKLAGLEEQRREAEERARAAEERTAGLEMQLEELRSRQRAAAEPPPHEKGAALNPRAQEDVLAQLEDRVANAERRAREAAENTNEGPSVSPEAMDLRARLARTAARKKHGTDEESEPAGDEPTE